MERDAYTAATMTLTKSVKGRLPQQEIKKTILETLKGTGDYREMYVMATAFKNEPLASCLEFILDPETMCLVASSEKQTGKLFHVAANGRASLVYVKHRDDKKYFMDPIGVQITGKAVQLKYGDAEPHYFMHRDFQSKNIHFKHGRIRIIDRQGPMRTSGREE